MSKRAPHAARLTAGPLDRLVSVLGDAGLVVLVLVAVPVIILVVGMPVVLVAWLIAGIAARW